MQKLLVKLFIKDYQNVNNEIVRTKYGTLSGFVGIITNIVLALAKIITGVLTFSVSIVADGINNLTDGLSSVITLIGFKLSAMPPDEEHPFGHQRFEYITGLIISFLILIIGFTIGKEAIEKIITPQVIEISYLAIGIMAISILVKLWQSLFYKKMGKAINSQTLSASSTDSLNDCISTGAVIIGMLIFMLFDINIDGYIGVFVALFIFISGIKLVKETISPLLGQNPSIEEIKMIEEKIMRYEGVLGVHDLVIHNYGPNRIFVTVHVEVASDVPINISHDIVDNIERDFRNDLKIDLTIHMDPIDIHDEDTKKTRDIILSIIRNYDTNLSIHDFRLVKGPTHTNVLFDIVMPIKYPKTAKELRKDIVDLIKELDATYNPVIQIDQYYNRNT